jgi:acyl carrier protein
MSTVVAQRKARIRELACDAFEIEEDQLTDTALFDEELGIDSLGLIDLIAGLEREYGIDTEQVSVTRIVNLDAVYDLVAELAGWPAPVEDRSAAL